MKMDNDTFARLVGEEVKGKATQAQQDFLRLPENWTHWQRALKDILFSLEQQLATIDEKEVADRERYGAMADAIVADANAKKAVADTSDYAMAEYQQALEDSKRPLFILAQREAEYEERRSKIKRFRHHVENRYDEVTRMIALGTEQVDERLAVVQFLRKGIQEHREMLDKFDLEPTAIDRALWAVLDGKWEFDSITEDTV